ncbi:MAG: hypothetical protein ACYTFU_11800 [Planctomycetota bacterium]|jgi:hypothetical protein
MNILTPEQFLLKAVNQENYEVSCIEQISLSLQKRFIEELKEYDHDWASEYLDTDEMDGDDFPVYSDRNLKEAYELAKAEVD